MQQTKFAIGGPRQEGDLVRVATRSGRMVLVSPDSSHVVDVHEARGGRFGPEASAVYDSWDDFIRWSGDAAIDFEANGVSFVPDQFGAPSPEPRQVFAVGLNYRDHADESGLAYPDSPPTFTKWVGSFAGPVGRLVLPAETVDWEAELVVVVGRRAESVKAADAWSYVAGAVAGDPENLSIECKVNGETMQKSSTDRLIFSIPLLIEHQSAVLPLMPGDVIFTGTPAGIGGARKPPRFLKDGDVVETSNVRGCARYQDPMTDKRSNNHDRDQC